MKTLFFVYFSLESESFFLLYAVFLASTFNTENCYFKINFGFLLENKIIKSNDEMHPQKIKNKKISSNIPVCRLDRRKTTFFVQNT